MIDLHTHSTASDGSLSPGELVEAAAKAGVTALALTDHDTLAGLDEGREAAAARGVYFIPGVELDITWEAENGSFAPPGDFHLLGLGIRRPGQAFFEALTELAKNRELRNREILARLAGIGVRAEYDELRAIAGGSIIGRPHIAELLIRRGIVKNTEQAFSRYLARRRPLYVPKQGLRFRDAVTLIRDAGGLPVLAHPLSLFVAWGRLPGLITGLVREGLLGLEAWHPTAKPRASYRLELLGEKLGLYITEGSDFHDPARPKRRLGYSAPGRKIDEAVLERIPELREKKP